MVRIATLDDHPVVSAGLAAMVEPEPDLIAVGSATAEAELWPLLRRAAPSLVVLDVHHPGRDGLALCMAIKSRPLAPRVVLYTSMPVDELVVPAALAGADAIVAKSESRAALLQAFRDPVGAAAPPLTAGVTHALLTAAARRLEPKDHSILAMRLAGTSFADIADTLGRRVAEVRDHTLAIMRTLTPVATV